MVDKKRNVNANFYNNVGVSSTNNFLDYKSSDSNTDLQIHSNSKVVGQSPHQQVFFPPNSVGNRESYATVSS